MKALQRFLFFFAVSLLVSGMALAQATTGSLTGTIVHEGAPLPGVTITISSPGLQGTRVAVSNVNGDYNFPALPPGQYTVVFEMEGMSTVTQSARVNLAQSARANAELRLSAIAEQITVTATAPATLETSEVQSNYSSDLIEELPIGRTVVATVSLAPGVNQNGPNNGVVISGAMSYDSTYYINGAQVNEVLRGQPLNVFIEDALEETTVITGAVSAEYGRFTGGVVTAISKSGGNEFSGSLRSSLINEAWTNRTPLEEPKGQDKILDTYEATLGGRILRDRLWFFAAGRYYERSTQRFLYESTTPYTYTNEETRLEGKLTWQLTQKHSLVGSYLDLTSPEKNYGFRNPYELSSLDESRDTPQNLASLSYNGILTSNFLLSAAGAHSEQKFVDSGGPGGDFAHASNCYNAVTGGFFCAPTFSSALGDGLRETDNWNLKGNYYFSSATLGTHNFVAGYEEFSETLKENNSQSGSDFTIYSYDPPEFAADGTLLPIFDTGNALIIWWPILQLSQGSDFNTQALFINDKWDLTSNWSFNIGVRYDKNDGVDESGAPVAKDDRFTPRLAATYDVLGDGRYRITASYSEYASKISGGNVGGAASPAGSPSLLYWLYYGPTISGLPSVQALDQMWQWFQGVGGVDNKDFLLGGGTGGIAAQIPDKLTAPGMKEFALGFGMQVGARGYVRLDFQDREWDNFYATTHTIADGTIYDPLAGTELDISITKNSDNFVRDYQAVIVQGAYRFTDRLSIGGNYTWSELTGNYVGETSGSGPVADTDPLEYYPELLAYPQLKPVGRLPSDQTHKARLWLGYDLPLGSFGALNFSVLERYDSATTYSAIGSIDTHQSSACPQCPPNPPEYVSLQTNNPYYFSDRGAFEWDDVSSTDLAINYRLPIGPVEFFVQAEVINLFDESAQVGGNTTILTQKNSSCRQGSNGPNPGQRCIAFNPFTETPVEGIHWQKGSSFGQAQNPTSQLVGGDYQLPLTYRGSLGIRF